MNIEEAILYLEHTSKDDFNLEEWQKRNRYQSIQVVLKEIERLNNIINELLKIIVQCNNEINMTTYRDMNNCEKWETKMTGYTDILDKAIDIIGSDKE